MSWVPSADVQKHRVVLDAVSRACLEARYQAWSGQGIRVLAVASRTLETQPSYSSELERDLDFVGFLTFFDRPRRG
jgi:P-type Mg2+ transporter